jgi:hypothetical protein
VGSEVLSSVIMPTLSYFTLSDSPDNCHNVPEQRDKITTVLQNKGKKQASETLADKPRKHLKTSIVLAQSFSPAWLKTTGHLPKLYKYTFTSTPKTSFISAKWKSSVECEERLISNTLRNNWGVTGMANVSKCMKSYRKY